MYPVAHTVLRHALSREFIAPSDCLRILVLSRVPLTQRQIYFKIVSNNNCLLNFFNYTHGLFHS
jgi:hypothetical protein